MMQESTISVDREDQELLKEAAEDMFGTKNVSYRVTIRHLVRRATNVPVDTE